jgi:Ni,Fe-hydrogenase I small subunit
VEELNYYPIDCVWKFTDANHFNQVETATEVMDNQRACLFKKGCVVPVTKSLNMTKKQNIEIVLYNNPPVPGFEPLLARYLVKM